MIWNRQHKVRVAAGALEKFLRRVEKELRVGEGEVTVCLVTDAEIARMNEEFRGKKGPTDVLSFPSERARKARAGINRSRIFPGTQLRAVAQKKGRSARLEGSYLGDIAIAPGVARRYAKKNERTLDSELRVLILHGVLHLLGYDHEIDRGEMDHVEQRMRRRFRLA